MLLQVLQKLSSRCHSLPRSSYCAVDATTNQSIHARSIRVAATDGVSFGSIPGTQENGKKLGRLTLLCLFFLNMTWAKANSTIIQYRDTTLRQSILSLKRSCELQRSKKQKFFIGLSRPGDYESGPYGISGPYSLNDKDYVSSDEATGVYREKNLIQRIWTSYSRIISRHWMKKRMMKTFPASSRADDHKKIGKICRGLFFFRSSDGFAQIIKACRLLAKSGRKQRQKPSKRLINVLPFKGNPKMIVYEKINPCYQHSFCSVFPLQQTILSLNRHLRRVEVFINRQYRQNDFIVGSFPISVKGFRLTLEENEVYRTRKLGLAQMRVEERINRDGTIDSDMVVKLVSKDPV